MSAIAAPMDKLMRFLLMEYRNSPNFIKYLSCMALEMQEIHGCLEQELTERYYDVAIGAQLDVIGEIVGAGRVLEGVSVAGYFGYLQSAESLGMGRGDDPRLGGVLRSNDDDTVQDIVLDDQLFRNWIDARIIKNRTSCNIEDTITFFRLLLNKPGLSIEITEPAPASVTIKLHEQLNIYEAAQVRSLAQHIKPLGSTFVVEDLTGVINTLPIAR